MTPQILAGKYVVQQEIARGGMGVIYKALDRSLNRIVAIKTVHAHLSGDSSFIERFLREARAMARLQHDNIVTIYAVEEDQGVFLLVMEYFPSRNLRELTKNRPRLPFREIVGMTKQLADALAFAHARGIVHRDIKPANVLVDTRGKVKLTDFGIAAALDEASITSAGQVIGTPEYMSPEQACGVKLDGRSDLYAVGILLYEMLTGKTPYAEDSKTSILGKLAFNKQELSLTFPSDVPTLLQGVVRDLLHRQPDDRMQDAETLTAQLHEVLYTLPSSPTPEPFNEPEGTILISPPTEQTAADSEPELPTILAPLQPIETSRTPAHSVPDDPTRFPPKLGKPGAPGASPTKPPTFPTPLPTPAPPSRPSSFRGMLRFGGGLFGAALLAALIYYVLDFRGSIDSTPPPPKEDLPRTPSDSKLAIRAARLTELEEIMSKLEALVSGTGKRLKAERQTSECFKLYNLLTETYGKFEGSVREVNAARQELEREPLPEPTRPSALDRPCERAKPFPSPIEPMPLPSPPVPPSSEPQDQRPKYFSDAQLSSLLEKFQTAYERRDAETLHAMSSFKEGRERNIAVMFSRYASFKTSIQNIQQTEDGATAQFVLDTAVSVTGEILSLPPLSRTFNLHITRQGDAWDKVLW